LPPVVQDPGLFSSASAGAVTAREHTGAPHGTNNH